MKFLGRGRIDGKEILTGVTLTPEDIGTLDFAASAASTVRVFSNLAPTGRDPKGVTGLVTSHALASAVFQPPRTVVVTIGTDTVPVAADFTFEGDAS